MKIVHRTTGNSKGSVFELEQRSQPLGGSRTMRRNTFCGAVQKIDIHWYENDSPVYGLPGADNELSAKQSALDRWYISENKSLPDDDDNRPVPIRI
jgi:hypothetical protein